MQDQDVLARAGGSDGAICDEDVYEKTEGGKFVPNESMFVASSLLALVDYCYYMLKDHALSAAAIACGAPADQLTHNFMTCCKWAKSNIVRPPRVAADSRCGTLRSRYFMSDFSKRNVKAFDIGTK